MISIQTSAVKLCSYVLIWNQEANPVNCPLDMYILQSNTINICDCLDSQVHDIPKYIGVNFICWFNK